MCFDDWCFSPFDGTDMMLGNRLIQQKFSKCLAGGNPPVNRNFCQKHGHRRHSDFTSAHASRTIRGMKQIDRRAGFKSKRFKTLNLPTRSDSASSQAYGFTAEPCFEKTLCILFVNCSRARVVCSGKIEQLIVEFV